MHLPENTDKKQLLQLGDCEIEDMLYKGKTKFLNVYFGDLRNDNGRSLYCMD